MRNASAEPNRTRLIAAATIARASSPVGMSSSGAATADRCFSHFTSGTSPPAARQSACPAREPGSTPTKTGEFQSRKPCNFGTNSDSEMKFSRHQIWLRCLHDNESIAKRAALFLITTAAEDNPLARASRLNRHQTQGRQPQGVQRSNLAAASKSTKMRGQPLNGKRAKRQPKSQSCIRPHCRSRKSDILASIYTQRHKFCACDQSEVVL